MTLWAAPSRRERFYTPPGLKTDIRERRVQPTYRRVAELCCVVGMTTDADSTLLESESGEPIASTHTSTRMSAQIQRIEVITGTEKRRRWSAEEKQAIVAESIAGTASITAVARKHGIGTGQLYEAAAAAGLPVGVHA